MQILNQCRPDSLLKRLENSIASRQFINSLWVNGSYKGKQTTGWSRSLREKGAQRASRKAKKGSWFRRMEFCGGTSGVCGEDVEACAKRETLEETGAFISIVSHGPFTNDIFHEERRHYVTLFVVADYVSGDIEAREPRKCEHWEWFEWTDLSQPLFLPIQNLLTTGFDPFS